MSTLAPIKFQPGQQVSNRYRLVKQLDTMTHPCHWLAEDPYRPDNPLCVVNIALADSDAGRCLREEARILQALRHPQLLTLLALDQQTPPYIYLVCDYVEGVLLSDRLLSGQRWTEQQVHELLYACLSILAVCHQQQVIHGNLHPGCLLQRSSDQQWMITGFGASQGTIGYIAPERGQGYPCVASDLYSLGMIAIQALTSQPPKELQQQAKTGGIRWQQHCHVERSLESLLSRMVAFCPSDRPTCAEDALEQLTPLSTQMTGAVTPVFSVKSQQPPALSPALRQAPLFLTSIATMPKPAATPQPAAMLTDLAAQFTRSPILKGLGFGTLVASACAGLVCNLPGKPATAVMGQVNASGEAMLKQLSAASNQPSRNTSSPRDDSGNLSGGRPALVPATQPQFVRSPSPRSQPNSPPPTPSPATNKPVVTPSPSQTPQPEPIRENQGDRLAVQDATIAAAAVGNPLQETLSIMAMADERQPTIAEPTGTPNSSNQPRPIHLSQAQEAPATMPVDPYPTMVIADDSYSLPTYSPAIDTQVTHPQDTATLVADLTISEPTDLTISEPFVEQVAAEQPSPADTEEMPIATNLPNTTQPDSPAVAPEQPPVLQTRQSEPIAPPLQVILSPDDHWMISISDTHTIKVWNLTAATDIPLNFSTPVAVHTIKLAADGSTLLSFAADGSQIAAWDLPSGQQVY
ncbi:MAG: protein kinase [Cyanobacteria bacterium]|nr:protein kinase [Cyanobacteriota bacterium]MDW8199792.1 protein kinase [Cyanobacteriota bacterium SKYGB_h_bin112]